MTDLSKLVKDPDGKIVIGQFPNPPLILWFGLMILSVVTSGHLAAVSGALAQLFLFVWAYLELTSGVTPVRKLMGLVVLTYVILRIVL